MRTTIRRAAISALVSMAMLAGTAGPLQAEFMFLSESAVFNSSTGEVQFTIEFNQAPDFFTVDAFGRQANEFQYFIVGDPTVPDLAHWDAIIRGGKYTSRGILYGSGIRYHRTRTRLRVAGVQSVAQSPLASMAMS